MFWKRSYTNSCSQFSRDWFVAFLRQILRILRRRSNKKCLNVILLLFALLLLKLIFTKTMTNYTQESQSQTPSTHYQQYVQCHGTAGQQLILEPPNMLILQELRVFERIILYEENFGANLLYDQRGDKTAAIKRDYDKVDNRNREVFRRWLRGDGRTPVNWNTLIEVLREEKLHTLADEISSKVRPADCMSSALPFDYSGKILEAIDPLRRKYSEQHVVVIDRIKTVHAKLPFLEVLMRDDIGNSKTLKSVLKSVQVHKQLLITGQPGSGKTTLMRYLAKQWADKKALLFCQILFLIILEDYKDDYHNLNDLLNVHYKEWDVHANDIVQRNGNGTCFLLDAFDEKLNKRDFVYRLMTNNELPFSVSIITSRPDDDLMEVKNQAEIVGFQFHKLDDYLFQLSDDKTAKRIQQEFWKDRQVKQMCQLPLHMAMVIFIAQSTQGSSIQTKTQIYTAFMNATIKHYKRDLHRWDAHALRQCIHHVLNDDLCKAFKHISNVAFEMTFNQRYTFPVDVTLQENIRRLGLVCLTVEDSTRDEYKFTFSHPTFMEFFAALHVVTLPQSQQRFHVQNPVIKRRQGLVDFYFGLLGDIYANNVTAVSLPLRHYSAAFASPLNKWEHVCPSKFYMAHSSSSLRLHQEIGWKGNAYKSLLQSAGIVIDSSACIAITSTYMTRFPMTSTMLPLHYLLEHANINRLSILGYSSLLSTVSFEDQLHPLNSSHLNILKCLNGYTGCINEQLHSTMTYAHLKASNFLTNSRTALIITNMTKFYKLKSLGLTVNDPYYLVSNTSELSGNLSIFNISSVEVRCCLQELWILLKHFPNITTLYMKLVPKCRSITHQIQIPTFALSTALTQPHRLQNLIIEPAANTNMVQLLRGPLTTMRYLRIKGMNINGTTANRIIRAANKNLTVLDLSLCSLHGLAIDRLATKLRFLSKLQNLNIYAVGLTDSDVLTLSKSIERLRNLTYLGLASNKINGEGLQQLVEVLKEIKTFRSLNLYGNPITGQENIRVLSRMTNLRALHISISSDEDKEALSSAVHQLPHLESFKWSRL